MEMMNAVKLPMFSRGHPHWDADEPQSVLTGLPHVAKKIRVKSAVALYGESVVCRGGDFRSYE